MKVFAHAQPLKHIDDGLVGWRLPVKEKEGVLAKPSLATFRANHSFTGVQKDFFVGKKRLAIFLGKTLSVAVFVPSMNRNSIFHKNPPKMAEGHYAGGRLS